MKLINMKLTFEQALTVAVGDKLFIDHMNSCFPEKLGWKANIPMEVTEIIKATTENPLTFRVKQGDKEDTFAWSWFHMCAVGEKGRILCWSSIFFVD